MTTETPECNGLCVTGSDVGVPSAAIAYAHPACQLHWGSDDDEIPEHVLAHDDRCGAVTGGGCDCREWERFDEDRSRRDDDLCDCSEGLCAGFDGCRDEYADAMPPPGRTCCGLPGCMGGCNFWAPTEPRP